MDNIHRAQQCAARVSVRVSARAGKTDEPEINGEGGRVFFFFVFGEKQNPAPHYESVHAACGRSPRRVWEA